MKRNLISIVSILAVPAFFSCMAPKVPVAREDILSWDYVMSQNWQQPAKLDRFVGVHPRYLLNREKVTALREKIKTTHKKLWKIVEERAHSYTNKQPPTNYESQGPMRTAGRDMPWMALAYLLSGDTVHFENAKRWVLTVCDYPHWDRGRSLGAGECLFAVALCYDWLYDRFTEAERAHIRDRITHHAELLKRRPQHRDRWVANHNHVENNGLAAAGFVLYGEVPQAADWLRQTGLNFRQAFECSGPDGSSEEGHQYWAYSTESLLCYAEAAKQLMGIDYYNTDFVKNAANFVIYGLLPDLRPKDYAMTYSDARRGYSGRNPVYILCRLASEHNNGFAQYFAEKMIERGIGRNDYKGWATLLWYDDNIKPVNASKFPTFKHFDNIGWVTARSGWDEDAVMVGFKCGPMHGHKFQPYYEKMIDKGWKLQRIGAGHCHCDINSFQIYAYGKWLAIDPGYERPKQTRTHSTIIVNKTGQLGGGLTWFDTKSVIEAKAKSTIIKTESSAAYDYVIGDAGNIYPASTGLKKFHRHLLFIRPDIVLIVDDLEADRKSEYEWRLHTEEGVEKVSDKYCIVKTGDVVMDTHLVHPATVKSTVDGRYLSVVPAEADRTQIITVLHPRRAKDKPSRVKLDSFKNDVVELSVETGRKKVNVQLDLAAQEVRIY